MMPLIAPAVWMWLSIVLPLIGLCALARLWELVREMARRLPDRNEDMVLSEHPLRPSAPDCSPPMPPDRLAPEPGVSGKTP